MTKLEEIAAAMSSGAEYAWDLTPTNRDYWLGMARAAVEAMRVPTEEMQAAAELLSMENSTDSKIYTAMIDAILNEKPE